MDFSKLDLKRITGGTVLVFIFLFQETIAWLLGQLLSALLPTTATGAIDLRQLPWAEIIGWVALLSGVSLIFAGIFTKTRPGKRGSSAREPASRCDGKESNQQTGPAVSGDSLVATATVRDPSPKDQLDRALYVGRMQVNDARLQSEHVLEISVIGFNGFRSRLQISNIIGSITACVKNGSAGVQLNHLLPTPTLLAKADYKKISEFSFTLEQVLRPAVAAEFLDGIKDHPIALDLTNLEVIVWAPDQEEFTATALPLWDGLRVQRTETLVTSRIINLAFQSQANVETSDCKHARS